MTWDAAPVPLGHECSVYGKRFKQAHFAEWQESGRQLLRCSSGMHTAAYALASGPRVGTSRATRECEDS